MIFNGEPYTVAGILPADFVDTPWSADVYLPARKYPNYKFDRGTAIGAVIARLRPGVSQSEAQTEINGIAARLAAAYPGTNRNRTVYLQPLKDLVVEDVRPPVTGLAFAVGFVLLIGCANVAGLFASRTFARERERSIRVALGASGARLISLVLAEALVLAAAGGAVGLLLAKWGVEAVSSAASNYLPAGTVLTLDRTALPRFTAVAAVITALLIAAIPAWQAARTRFLRDARGAGSGAWRNRTRGILVAGEVALALVLLVGSGLTLKSLFRVESGAHGIRYAEPDHLRIPDSVSETLRAVTRKWSFTGA